MKIVASYVKDLLVFSQPLLHVAASRELSNTQMVGLLIQQGIDVNAPYQEGYPENHDFTRAPIPSYAAAHVLAMGKHWWNIAALESLCKAGADLDMTQMETVIQFFNVLLMEIRADLWELAFGEMKPWK